MKKQLLKIEFRYVKLDENGDQKFVCNTNCLGIFDTIEESVKNGNKLIEQLKKYFEVRPEDKFSVSGLFGHPNRLVSNCCYPTNGISYFAKIEQLDFSTTTDIFEEIFKN